MAGYGWDEYDIRTGGRQTIHDAGNTIDLTIEFIKVPGGSNGGSWGARIKGEPREGGPPVQMTTLVFYAAMEGFGSLEVANEIDELGYEGTVTFNGQTVELGDFKIDVTQGPGTNRHPPPTHESYEEKPLDRTMVASVDVPPDALWQAKSVLFQHMKDEVDGYIERYRQENNPPPWQTFTIANDPQDGNFHMVQKVFEGPFEFDILFSSASAPKPLNSEILTEDIKTASEDFSDRFAILLNPKEPFTSPKYRQFSKAMLSNLVGGIGYFHGDSIVDRSYAAEYEEENDGFWEETAEARGRATLSREPPAELFTSIPSRPFFPRGFLWDEGFHLLPVLDWDVDLT